MKIVLTPRQRDADSCELTEQPSFGRGTNLRSDYMMTVDADSWRRDTLSSPSEQAEEGAQGGGADGKNVEVLFAC